jgi:hypothetical protein
MHSMDSLSVSLSPKVSIVLCFVRYALDGFFICIVITQGIHCSLFSQTHDRLRFEGYRPADDSLTGEHLAAARV